MNMNSPKNVFYIDLGLTHYGSVLSLQERLREARLEGTMGDVVLFCQHHPVYTVGKQDCSDDMLSSIEAIRRDGIEVVQVNRGGRITYHGPGQLVVYFILKIGDFRSGVKEFVAGIEDCCIDLVSRLGLTPSKKTEHPGIWLGDKKIAAIGLNISKGVSMHGMAINVDPNMSHYRHIVPCGIRGLGVTSLVREMRERRPSMDEVKEGLIESIERVFDRRMEELAGQLTENVRLPEPPSVFSEGSS